MTLKKQEQILHELYRQAFAASTPPGDWDRLLAEAQLNENGQKVVPFMDYECETEIMEQILATAFKKHRVPEYVQRQLKFAFWLGCSPKSKTNDQSS